LNIHAAGTWKEVLEYLIKYDINRALIHWYTGPIDLVKEIERLGYYISINPALKVGQKSGFRCKAPHIHTFIYNEKAYIRT